MHSRTRGGELFGKGPQPEIKASVGVGTTRSDRHTHWDRKSGKIATAQISNEHYFCDIGMEIYLLIPSYFHCVEGEVVRIVNYSPDRVVIIPRTPVPALRRVTVVPPRL